MLIAGVSDIHSPKYFEEFRKAIRDAPEPDLLLICGDVVYKGDHEEVKRVESVIREYISCPVVGCFGNEEYEPETVKKFSKIIHFLNDDSLILDVRGKKIGIVGSKGSLDKPTWWQKRNIPGIERTYSERIERLRSLLLEMDAEMRILITHYAPTYLTLRGENPKAFPQMGSLRMEKMIKETMPDLVIHGHSHRGKSYAEIATVFRKIPVYNVALPLNHKITLIKI